MTAARFTATRSRRLALATAVVVGLAACGSASEVTSPSTADSGTTVDTSTTGAAAPTPSVIKVAGGSGGVAATGSSADQAVSPESSKMMIAAFYNYVYGGDAVDLTAPAPSWSFEQGATPSPDQILQIAKALGIEGEVRELDADVGGGWAVGSDDYSEPSINVGADATLGWWYNAGYDDTAVSSPCAVDPAVDPAAGEAASSDTASEAPAPDEPVSSIDNPAATDVVPVDEPICETQQPPVGVPTAEQAEAAATELLTAFGLDPASYEFETYADEWSASVTGFLLLDGVKTPMSTSFGFGAEGALTWAGGFLATPIRSADYPRIGVEAAVQRLNDQNQGWGYGVSPTARAEAAPTDDMAVEPGIAVDVPAIQEPEPDDSVEMEEITVTLTDPQPSIEMLWATDGTVWLLPGYRFDGGEAGTFSVLAVADEFIEVEQAPTDVPGDTTDTAAPTDSVPVVATTAPTDDTECATTAAEVPVEVGADGSGLLGLCEADAVTAAESAGFRVRVTRLDGLDLPSTMDYSPTRFNVAVDQGIVTEVISVG